MKKYLRSTEKEYMILKIKTKSKRIQTLLYSQRKPERGICISCNGHCMTLSIKAFTLGGCKTFKEVKIIAQLKVIAENTKEKIFLNIFFLKEVAYMINILNH